LLGGPEGLYGYGDAEPQTKRRGRSGRLTDGGIYGETGALGAGGRSSRIRTKDRNETLDKELLAKKLELARKPSTNDIYYEYDKIRIMPRTDLSKMREPLLFWAHDDSIEPMKSYRYRIRFSDTTEAVTIPGMEYFFAKDVQEAAKTVTVTVCKYVLGYWYSDDFAVRQGEAIGKVVESEPKENQLPVPGLYGSSGLYGPSGSGLPGLSGYGQLAGSVTASNQFTEPESINYDTRAVLVDIIAVNDWLSGKNMRARHYFDMLYSFDGTVIEHMPINSRYWSAELQIAFGEITRLKDEPKEPLRAWGSRPAALRRRTDLGYDEYQEGYEDLMYEEQMMMDGRGGRY
jgi:hypothetical protein